MNELWAFCFILVEQPACVIEFIYSVPVSSLYCKWIDFSTDVHPGSVCECVNVVLYVLSLLCASNPQVPGAPGEQLKRGSGGLSALGSRCSSPFHCSPYGPAALGPQGPVSAAPPRPGPCHQAPLPSCLTPAPGLTITS